jgi:hypothetical protein
MKTRHAWDAFLGLAAVSLFLHSTTPAAAAAKLRVLNSAHWPTVTSGMPWRVAVDGHYAYVGLYRGGVVVVDLSHPGNCVRVGSLDTVGDGCAVAIAGGGYAYATLQSGLAVVAITNPALPVVVGQCATNLAMVSGALAVAGGRAGVAGSGGFDLLAVTNPAVPVLLGTCRTPLNQTFGMAMTAGYAYLAGGDSLHIVALTNPAAPVVVGQCVSNAYSVAVCGGNAYVGTSAISSTAPRSTGLVSPTSGSI